MTAGKGGAGPYKVSAPPFSADHDTIGDEVG